MGAELFVHLWKWRAGSVIKKKLFKSYLTLPIYPLEILPNAFLSHQL